jgi:hypothetical protein
MLDLVVMSGVNPWLHFGVRSVPRSLFYRFSPLPSAHAIIDQRCPPAAYSAAYHRALSESLHYLSPRESAQDFAELTLIGYGARDVFSSLQCLAEGADAGEATRLSCSGRVIGLGA